MTGLLRALALCALLGLSGGCIFLSDDAPAQQPADSAPDGMSDLPDAPADLPDDLPPDEVPDQPDRCDDALSRCGAACVDLSSSNAHCGACDRSCGVGGSCDAGSCVCPQGAQGRTLRQLSNVAKPPLLRLIPFFHSDQARANDPDSVHYLAATLDLASRTLQVDGLNALGALVNAPSSYVIPEPQTMPVQREPVAIEGVSLPNGALFVVVMRGQGQAVLNDALHFVRMAVNAQGEVSWTQMEVGGEASALRGSFGGLQLTIAREGVVLVARMQEVFLTQAVRLGPQHLKVALLKVSALDRLTLQTSYKSATLNSDRPSAMVHDAQYPLRLHVEERGDVSELGVTFCQEQVDGTCEVTSHLFALSDEDASGPTINATQSFVSGLSQRESSTASKAAYGLGSSDEWTFFAYHSNQRGDALALQTTAGEPFVVSEVNGLSAVTLTAQQTSALNAGDLEMGWLQSDSDREARGYHASWRFLNGSDDPLPETLRARQLTREGALSQLQSASSALPGSVLYVALEQNAQLKSWSVIDGQAACEPLSAWPARRPSE